MVWSIDVIDGMLKGKRKGKQKKALYYRVCV